MKIRLPAVIIGGMLLAAALSHRLYANAPKKEGQRCTAVGRFIISAGTPVRNKMVWIYFNERLWGKYRARTDDSGYFSVRLPVGRSALALVEYSGGKGGIYYKNVPDSALVVDVAEGDDVVYIGDIEMDWVFSKSDLRVNGGVMGVVKEAGTPAPRAQEFRVSVNAATKARFEAARKSLVTDRPAVAP